MKTISILFWLVFVVCSNITIPAYTQAINKQDSLALVDLFKSTNGPNWYSRKNWLKGPVSTWEGISVTGTRVTGIYLRGNNLIGNIPSSIGNLVQLTYLNFGEDPFTAYNGLTGSIPPSLGNLVNLLGLDLSNNHLSGSIPSSLGNLVNLFDLVLSYNRLSGSIPPSLGNLVNLSSLYLDHNQLSGSIPFSLGNLVNISNLFLNNNQLSGSIPSSTGNLANLGYLNLSHNKLSGKIPPAIANLQNLYALDLSYNHFTLNGMELIAQTSSFAIYDHQALIPIHQNGDVLSVSAGGTLKNNTYKWLRITKTSKTLVATISGDSVFHPSQRGIYLVRVTNSVATGLTLRSDTIHYAPSAEFVESVSATSENALLQHNKTDLFFVYPNPAKDILHIQTNGKVTITLTDHSGKILFTKNINGKEEINVSNLAAGLYYLKNTLSGVTQKVIITK